jgi:hypothetical protein
MPVPPRTSSVAALRAQIEGLPMPYSVGLYRVWLRSIQDGGSAQFIEFDAYLHGIQSVASMNIAVIDHTMWEIEQFGIDG